MDGTGFRIPRRADLTPTGCLWMSSLFENRAPSGKVPLTSYLGGARLPSAAEWNDNRSVAEILQVLRPLLGIRANRRWCGSTVTVTRYRSLTARTVIG